MPRIVVVTGTSAGIGRASALAFGARGDTVVLLARGEAGLAGAAQEVERARQIVIAGAGADLLHSASMVGAAIALPRYRRAALASAAVASVSAALAAVAVRRPQ